uniref:Ig-like domain-containing protein n=1 Tax=Neogobius melanostomus TaxID=47308 RepID=A0A8C6TZ85_9GOBI
NVLFYEERFERCFLLRSCLNPFINILLSLTGQTLVVPSQPLVVPVGSEVTLPCQLESVKNIKDLVVDWGRPDLKPRYVHIRRDALDLLIDQNSLYLGRTRLSERGLAYGDLSLTLSRVRLSDAGTYHCFIPQMDTRILNDFLCYFPGVPVSVSPVSVSLTKDHSGSPVLRCESRGWFPEPELVWLDSEGTVLTGARTEAQRGVNEETFSVSSRLSVEQSPGNSFTCRVRHQETRQSRENQIRITGEKRHASHYSLKCVPKLLYLIYSQIISNNRKSL